MNTTPENRRHFPLTRPGIEQRSPGEIDATVSFVRSTALFTVRRMDEDAGE